MTGSCRTSSLSKFTLKVLGDKGGLPRKGSHQVILKMKTCCSSNSQTSLFQGLNVDPCKCRWSRTQWELRGSSGLRINRRARYFNHLSALFLIFQDLSEDLNEIYILFFISWLLFWCICLVFAGVKLAGILEILDPLKSLDPWNSCRIADIRPQSAWHDNLQA